MSSQTKLAYGTMEWFRMVGETMCQAALDSHLPSDVNYSLVEHFVDGDEWSDGLFEGYRFEIAGGKPMFRLGARPGEVADLILRVRRDASRAMHKLHGHHPEFMATIEKFTDSDDFVVVQGNLADLFELLGPIHDVIVDKTA